MRKTCELTDFVNFSFATNIKLGSMNDKEGQRKTTEAYIFWTPETDTYIIIEDISWRIKEDASILCDSEFGT